MNIFFKIHTSTGVAARENENMKIMMKSVQS